MSTELRSSDGRYLAVEQDDRNFVVYLAATMTPLFDRWSYEGSVPPAPPQPPSPQPPPGVPSPAPGGGAMRVIPVTTANDGAFAPRMMSDRANAWVFWQTAYVFAGSRVTGGPLFFEVDLHTGHVIPRGPIVPYGGETEGWFWLPDGRLVLLDGPRLRVTDPLATRGVDQVLIDIRERNPGWDLWQPHASDDGQTFSATVRDTANPLPSGKYPNIGTVTLHHGKRDYWPAIGVLDESQLSRNGRWIVIKEDRGTGDDIRVIDFDTRETHWLRDQERALGHSDCGPDYIVGEADKPSPGACVIRYLDRLQESPRILFHTDNMGYVSTRGGRCLLSGPTHISLVALDGAGVTPLIEYCGGSGYDDRVKANLSPCGRVACYMVNGAVFLLVLP